MLYLNVMTDKFGHYVDQYVKFPDLVPGGEFTPSEWADPIQRLLAMSWVGTRAPIPLSRYFSANAPHPALLATHFPPKQVSYSTFDDFGRYSSPLSRLVNRIVGGHYIGDTASSPHGEHSVDHLKFEGTVNPFPNNRLYIDDLTVGDITVNTVDLPLYDSITSYNASEATFGESVDTVRLDYADLVWQLYDLLTDPPSSGYLSTGWWISPNGHKHQITHEVSNLAIDVDNDGFPFVLTYDMERFFLEGYAAQKKYEVHLKQTVTIKVRPFMVTPIPTHDPTFPFAVPTPMTVAVEMITVPFYKESRLATGGGDWTLEYDTPQTPSTVYYGPGARKVVTPRYPVGSPAAIFNSFVAARYNTRTTRQLSFADGFRIECEAMMPEIRKSAFYTTAETVKDYMTVLSDNHLETLSDLRDLGGLLPDYKLLLRFFKLNATGKFVSTGLSLLDFVTSANLLYKFGLAPTVDSGKDIVDNFAPLVDKIKGINESFGKRHSKLITDLSSYWTGPGEPTLITRSTVTCELNDAALAALLFPAEAMGILPRLGTLWDLVPFSFVADWFFNIGDRLENIDYQVMMSALQLKYCVHSYEIIADVPEAFLNAYGLYSASPLNPPRLRFYKREVSKFVPTLKPGLIDFTPAQGVPDITVAGSLVWSIVRST